MGNKGYAPAEIQESTIARSKTVEDHLIDGGAPKPFAD